MVGEASWRRLGDADRLEGPDFSTGIDDQSKKLLATCLARKDGSILWQKEVGIGFQQNDRNNMAAPSAITDGKQAYFYYGTGDLAAFDMDGNAKWRGTFRRISARFT